MAMSAAASAPGSRACASRDFLLRLGARSLVLEPLRIREAIARQDDEPRCLVLFDLYVAARPSRRLKGTML